MAINYPGPYELRIKYTESSLATPTIQHTQRLNISLVEPASQGDVFGNYTINDVNGATAIALSTVTENYLTVFNALFDTSMTIDAVELWKYPVAQSFQSVFWSSYTPTANAGTTAGTPSASSQNIYTFRSQEGNLMKVETHEGLQPPGSPESYAAMEAAQTAFVDFILDGNGTTYSAPFLARDTSYPFSFNRMFPGQNEKTWKARNGR